MFSNVMFSCMLTYVICSCMLYLCYVFMHSGMLNLSYVFMYCYTYTLYLFVIILLWLIYGLLIKLSIIGSAPKPLLDPLAVECSKDATADIQGSHISGSERQAPDTRCRLSARKGTNACSYVPRMSYIQVLISYY